MGGGRALVRVRVGQQPRGGKKQSGPHTQPIRVVPKALGVGGGPSAPHMSWDRRRMGQSDTGPQVAPPIPPLGTPKKSRENSTRPLKNGFVINAAYSQKKKINKSKFFNRYAKS